MKHSGVRRAAVCGVWGTLLALQVGCSSAEDSSYSDRGSPAAAVPSPDASKGDPYASNPPWGNQAAAGASSGTAAVGNVASDSAQGFVDPPPAAKATNGFVITAHDPQSTFGADVDTASYDLFRRDINLGVRPDPASVRLEEYVNDFKYSYPAPAADSDTPFSISLAASPGLYGRETQLLRVGIRGKEAKPTEKLPSNLVFLV